MVLDPPALFPRASHGQGFGNGGKLWGEVVARDVDTSMIHRLFFCVLFLFLNRLNAIDVCYLDFFVSFFSWSVCLIRLPFFIICL